jgi:hypothetical protein
MAEIERSGNRLSPSKSPVSTEVDAIPTAAIAAKR